MADVEFYWLWNGREWLPAMMVGGYWSVTGNDSMFKLDEVETAILGPRLMPPAPPTTGEKP